MAALSRVRDRIRQEGYLDAITFSKEQAELTSDALLQVLRCVDELASKMKWHEEQSLDCWRRLRREYRLGSRRSLVERIVAMLQVLQGPLHHRQNEPRDPVLATAASARLFEGLTKQCDVIGPGAWVFLELLTEWIRAQVPRSAVPVGAPYEIDAAFDRALPGLPTGWGWRADNVVHLMPEEDGPWPPIYLWRAVQLDDGDGDVGYDGIGTIKIYDCDESVAAVVRAAVVEANRCGVKMIENAWADREGSHG